MEERNEYAGGAAQGPAYTPILLYRDVYKSFEPVLVIAAVAFHRSSKVGYCTPET